MSGKEVLIEEGKRIVASADDRGLCLPSDIRVLEEDLNRIIECVKRQFR